MRQISFHQLCIFTQVLASVHSVKQLLFVLLFSVFLLSARRCGYVFEWQDSTSSANYKLINCTMGDGWWGASSSWTWTKHWSQGWKWPLNQAGRRRTKRPVANTIKSMYISVLRYEKSDHLQEIKTQRIKRLVSAWGNYVRSGMLSPVPMINLTNFSYI